MLTDKCSVRFSQGLVVPLATLIVFFLLFSNPASAIIIEGKVNGLITDVFTEGNRSDGAFFDVAVAGQSFHADFWYEFDENNFPPTYAENSFREYDFSLFAMEIVVHVGDESYSSTTSSEFPLTHFRNMISIFRGEHFSYFDMMTYTEYSSVNPRTENRLVSINFPTPAMEYFSGLDLEQNISVVATNGSSLGEMQIFDYGTRDGDRYPGDFYTYDANVYGSITSFDMHVRGSVVDEPGSLGLIALALLLMGWCYRFHIKPINKNKK
ncbi:hypothetical protein [Cellvibrio sp.]